MSKFSADIAPPRAGPKRFDSIGNVHVAAHKVTARKAMLSHAQRQDFINAMSGAVTGVNLITTDGRAGKFGITVSAMSSVSAEPPMLLACINTRSPACAAIRSNQIFCVNVLSTRQRRLANAFAGNADQGDAYDFSIGQWERGFMDVLRLVDAASSFDCALEQSYDAGSHTIFIGRVTASTGGSFSPLLYTNRNYGFPCQSE